MPKLKSTKFRFEEGNIVDPKYNAIVTPRIIYKKHDVVRAAPKTCLTLFLLR